MIALPALLSVGLPPQIALGTNKFQGSFGTLSAATNFICKGKVKLSDNLWGMAYTLIGAAEGSWAIQQIHADFISHLVPFMLLFVFFYTLAAKDLGMVQAKAIKRGAPFIRPIFLTMVFLTIVRLIYDNYIS